MVVRMLTIKPEDSQHTSDADREVSTEYLVETNSALLSTDEIPFRLPSFVKPSALNNHAFEVNDEAYEYVNGQYFKRVSILGQGSSFGDIALQRRCLRTASIKSETDV